LTRRLTNLRVRRVSLVKRGANRRRILFKSDTGVAGFDVLKTDDERQIAYGVVYEPGVVDVQDEFAEAEDIEKAAHGFMVGISSGESFIDERHTDTPLGAYVVESFIAPTDFSYDAGERIRKGTWVMAVHVPDKSDWERIKKDYTGFSMAGTAQRERSADDYATWLREAQAAIQNIPFVRKEGTGVDSDMAEVDLGDGIVLRAEKSARIRDVVQRALEEQARIEPDEEKRAGQDYTMKMQKAQHKPEFRRLYALHIALSRVPAENNPSVAEWLSQQRSRA